MRWKSVRVRLILWNVTVLGIVLAGFGVALCYTAQASQASDIDRELAHRAHGFCSAWGHDGPDHAGREPGPWFPGPRWGRRREPPPDRRSASPPPGPWSPPVESAPQHDFRRPRLVSLEGRPLGPYSQDQPWDSAALTPAAGGQERFSCVHVDGEPVRVFSAPLRRAGLVEGVIQVAYPLAENRRLNDGLLRTFLALILPGLLVAALGGLFLTDRALRPVREVTQAAAQIGAEDLACRLPVSGRDEFSELATTFNGMIARLEHAFQDLQEAYEQQRRFTSDASHELRTPLTAIKANTSLALCGSRSTVEYREALQAADQAADLMSRVVQDLLLLARSDAGRLGMERKPVGVEAILRRAMSVAPGRGSAPVDLRLEDPELAVEGDADHLTRLFVNLLENAGGHTPSDGRITLTAGALGSRVEIAVQDNGEGISPEHLPHVGKRFYRVDAARARVHGGTGLGLAICRSIALAHGGTLNIESAPGAGTTVRVILPRAELPALQSG
jgi:two-component system OmpR family sensor kinase